MLFLSRISSLNDLPHANLRTSHQEGFLRGFQIDLERTEEEEMVQNKMQVKIRDSLMVIDSQSIYLYHFLI